MPIAIGDQVYEDEVHYNASLLGIELPKEDTPSTSSSTTTSTTPLKLTTLPADALNSPIGIKVPGNINIHQRPVVHNDDGSISTVRSISVGTDDGEALIPTVAADGSRILSDDEAIAQYKATGQHLGIFDTPENATAYAQSLHNQQAEEYLPKERYQTWPERMVRGAISAMALPGDVLSGKVQPGSPQEIERAFDLAGLMVFGPAPVASKLADGTLGSFAGVTSKTLDRNKLAEAQIMTANGVHPDDVWKKTGFFQGADGRWRYEIPDSSATLKDTGFIKTTTEGDSSIPKGWGGEPITTVSVRPSKQEFQTLEEALNYAGKFEGVKLSDALDHPELFKAYPHLKDMEVAPLPKPIQDKGILGQVSGNTLYLKDDLDPEFAKSVILHEVQHFIQQKEGFARGGNTSEFLHPNLEKAQKLYEDAIAAGGDPKSPALTKARKIIEDEKKAAFDKYHRLMGEVEARNVQNRMDMDEIERYSNSPASTEKIPRDQQIFRN